nr:MAG TPA: hypothetical protein [Bacteriophage sp.]
MGFHYSSSFNIIEVGQKHLKIAYDRVEVLVSA